MAATGIQAGDPNRKMQQYLKMGYGKDESRVGRGNKSMQTPLKSEGLGR